MVSLKIWLKKQKTEEIVKRNNNMENENLKDIIQQANDAVSGVSDPDLKKIAFQKILDKLFDDNINKISKHKSEKKIVSKAATSKISSNKKEKDLILSELLRKINRTKYSEIHNLTKALDKSLYILKICKDDLGVDGLVPSQISGLLRGAFRIKMSKESVSMALGAATKYVDRNECVINGGRAFIYKIMHDGEKYLNEALLSSKSE